MPTYQQYIQWLQGQNAQQPVIPKTEIPRVSGEAGARAYQMGVNSETLMLDEKEPIVWFVQTNEMGYKTTVSPYLISAYQPEPPIDAKSLEDRITAVEAALAEVVNNGKSNSSTGKKRTSDE